MTDGGRLIGVVDLRAGRAVHAVAGKRHQYRDVAASGIETGDAIALVQRYRRLGVTSLYIADLDAISGSSPNTELLIRLSSLAESVLMDAGSYAVNIANELSSSPAIRYIVPTESYVSLDQWTNACQQVGCQRVALGLDLIGHRLRTSGCLPETALRCGDPQPAADLLSNIAAWIDEASRIQVNTVVALDLAYVGTNQGPGTVQACRLIADRWPQLELISGGGVRDVDDVNSLLRAGCNRVLVATALHHHDEFSR